MNLAQLQSAQRKCKQELEDSLPSFLCRPLERANDHGFHEVACGVVASIVKLSRIRAAQYCRLQDTVVEATEVFWIENNMPKALVRISVIVDGCFSLIVDGETAVSKGRWGSAQAQGLNVAQSSTISLKRAAVGRAPGSVSGSI